MQNEVVFLRRVAVRILNLYAGIGGNRALWGDDHEIVAVENDPKIAAVYAARFPKDTVVVEDAHEYLLKHFQEFDFIWSSPPCPTHSRTNYFIKGKGIFRYPDLRLWQEIIFLRHFFKGKWCVENVQAYYGEILGAQKVGRHYLWANFVIPHIKTPKSDVGGMNGKWQSGRDKTQGERNAVWAPLGLHVLLCASQKVVQVTL